MKLKKIPTTWRGIQNTDATTEGDMQDFLAGTDWVCDGKYEWSGTFELYRSGALKYITLKRDHWFVISSKGKVKTMDPWKFAKKFEVDE